MLGDQVVTLAAGVDEAHRTTGVTLFGEDESNFVKVHDVDYLKAVRRLYMTATPRIFDESVKDKAQEHSAELSSMDDATRYGQEFHRLSFGDAVERGLLTDYKVIVLTVDEDLVASPLQQQLAGSFSELRLDDASKIVGCWNGLAKRAGKTPDGIGFAPGEAPMRRAVVFAKDIAASKQVADVFPAVVDAYRDLLTDSENDGHAVSSTNLDLACSVHHVDGTFNALQRNAELSWLKAPVPDGECRILTNQVKTDKASGIVNDRNDWCDEHDDLTYIVDPIKRVTTVAVETMKIVDSL